MRATGQIRLAGPLWLAGTPCARFFTSRNDLACCPKTSPCYLTTWNCSSFSYLNASYSLPNTAAATFNFKISSVPS